MRDYKLRGKRVDNGEWVYGSLIVIKNEYVKAGVQCFICPIDTAPYQVIVGKTCSLNNLIMVDPKTVGQYTELKDKNGREIYEGDIVRTIGSWWTVEYYKTDCAFRLIAARTGHVGSCGLIDIKDTYEGIGNIYENPELLKQ